MEGYQTDWHADGFRRLKRSAFSPDRETILEWVNDTLDAYPPQGYASEATVIPVEDGWLGVVTRSAHCD